MRTGLAASLLCVVFPSPKATLQRDEPKSDTRLHTRLPSSSYAISSHGETTDLHAASALRPREDTTSTGEGKSLDGDRKGVIQQDRPASGEDGCSNDDKPMADQHETNNNTGGTQGEPKVMKEYSAEALTYHAFYDEVGTLDYEYFPNFITDFPQLQRAHLRGHYTWCRDNCLKLLAEPRIPLRTRIQTLQLLSTMLKPAGGEQCLHGADRLIDKLDSNQFQTQLLREDNRKMKAERMDDDMKKDIFGKDIKGLEENASEGLSDEQLKMEHHRELDEKLRQELEVDRELDEKLRQELEEMESIRKRDV